MIPCQYPPQTLIKDYMYGGVGLAIGIGGWLLAPDVLHVIVIFGALTLLFLLFTIRTVLRQRVRIEFTEDGLMLASRSAQLLRWDELRSVRLRYYSTRRNKSGGWMELKLATPRQRLTVDSALDGFDTIAARAATAIQVNKLNIDDATRANLAALGLNREAMAADESERVAG